MGRDGSLKRVEKPWGEEIWFAETEKYAGKLLRIQAGRRLSTQYHEHKDETSYLLSGALRVFQGPSADTLTSREVKAGATWRNEPGTIHSVEAVEDSVVIEVSTPEVADVVRLADRYGRAPAEI